jgi:hypothetical protein
MNDQNEWECVDDSLKFSLDGTQASGETDELGPIAIIYAPKFFFSNTEQDDGSSAAFIAANLALSSLSCFVF